LVDQDAWFVGTNIRAVWGKGLDRFDAENVGSNPA
jgi:hypothetical protein